jgi:hypothetical protein
MFRSTAEWNLTAYLHPVLCSLPCVRQVLLHVLLIQQAYGKLSGRPAGMRTC